MLNALQALICTAIFHVLDVLLKQYPGQGMTVLQGKGCLEGSSHADNMYPGQNTAAAAAAKPPQSCLPDPTDCSPPGSPIRGILQARILEWVAISFSNA